MSVESNFDAANTTDTINSVLVRLDQRNIVSSGGYAYIYKLPSFIPAGDSEEAPFRSQVELFENGVALGPAHALHDLIDSEGRGRFCHWDRQLFFSASDNTSPKTNKRQYQLLVPAEMFAVPGGVSVSVGTTKSVLLRLDRAQVQIGRGFGYGYALPSFIPKGDSEEMPFCSQVELFENGVALGPAHVPYEQICSLGGGRFSHWQGGVFFSARDNSSPLENRRQYHLLVPAGMFSADSASVALRDFALNDMTPMERFDFARRFYRSIWQDTPLPDHGRRIDHDAEFAREFMRLSPESDVTHERKYNLDQLFRLASQVEGDVVECGAYKGASAFFLARHILKQGLAKRLCLFDSFEGLSVPSDTDGDYWSAGTLKGSVGDILSALAPLGPLPFVEFYKGWIPERFTEVADRRFCFIHIDVDLYQPTLDSIAFFYPRMMPGGIILLDDYGFASCPGVTQAIDQFMADKPESLVNLASGGAFIMKRAASER